MMTKIKIDDTTVAEVGMVEAKRIYGKTELANRKADLEKQLLDVNEFLALLP